MGLGTDESSVVVGVPHLAQNTLPAMVTLSVSAQLGHLLSSIIFTYWMTNIIDYHSISVKLVGALLLATDRKNKPRDS